jgi:hypothetical protein
VLRFRILLAAGLVLRALPGLAQQPDPFTSARVHIGPFAVNPSMAVRDVGVDTNVFNDWNNPKSDFTATIAPAADIWLRMGRARLNVKTGVTYLFFAKYAGQRGFGTSDEARLEFGLIHLKPWVGGSYLTMRDRPGFEIDTRVRYTVAGYSAGADVPLSSRTTLGAGVKRVDTRYQGGESYYGYSLQQWLNRTTTTVTGSARYRLTPLTTLVLSGESVRERFEFSPVRDSNGFRLVPGVEFDATALVNGSAHVGFRHLKMLAPGMPDYNGPVASVDLGYVLMGVTRFAVQVARDVDYSFDPAWPFYVLTGVSGSVSQAVGGPWSVTARAGIQRLAYQVQAGVGGSVLEGAGGRADVIHSYGAGIGYKLGPLTRLGVNADYYTRSSDVTLRAFHGLRVGSSVTYGF